MKTKQTIAFVVIIAVILGIVFISQNQEKIVNIITFDNNGDVVANESFSHTELVSLISEAREAPLADNAIIYPEKTIMQTVKVTNAAPYDESDITDMQITLDGKPVLVGYKPVMTIPKGAKSRDITLPKITIPSSYSRYSTLHMEFTVKSNKSGKENVVSYDVAIDMSKTAQKKTQPWIFYLSGWFK